MQQWHGLCGSHNLRVILATQQFPLKVVNSRLSRDLEASTKRPAPVSSDIRTELGLKTLQQAKELPTVCQQCKNTASASAAGKV